MGAQPARSFARGFCDAPALAPDPGWSVTPGCHPFVKVSPSGARFPDCSIRSVVDLLRSSHPTTVVDASRFVEGIRKLEQDSVDIFELLDKVASTQGLSVEVRDYILSKRREERDMNMAVV